MIVKIRFILSCARRLIKKYQGDPSIIYISRVKESIMQVKLANKPKSFIDKYLHVIDVNVPITENSINDYNFDGYIVGSDQVWRPRYCKKTLMNNFLDFTNGINVKRLSYAASFGVDSWEFTKDETTKCAELIKTFNAISVREASAVDLCKQYLGVESKQVLDPTLLLSSEDYINMYYSREENIYNDYIAV